MVSAKTQIVATVKWKCSCAVLGLAACHVDQNCNKNAGTYSWPSWISHFTGSFVGHSPSEMLCPPAEVKYGELIHENHEKIEVLHLFRCVTHTDIYICRDRGREREREILKSTSAALPMWMCMDVRLACIVDLISSALPAWHTRTVQQVSVWTLVDLSLNLCVSCC